ncbi:MAG: hypothetical protein KJ661_05940 [Candidatus Omnitrophica bacterium]|nr:hypothetical protein [Candidatus Omnitrophota bacterium]
MSDYRKFWDSATFKATVISSGIAVIIAIIGFLINWHLSMSANKIAQKANGIAEKSSNAAQEALTFTKKEFAIQYTPELRAYMRSWNIYVGDGTKIGRKDNVIEIPLAICNKSYGIAKDVKLNLLYNYGTGGDKEMGLVIPVIKGTESIPLPSFVPSILAGAQEAYASKKNIFKMKIFLDWEDASGKKYNSVELFELDITESYSDYPSSFRFTSIGYYNTVTSSNEFNKYSLRKIDY